VRLWPFRRRGREETVEVTVVPCCSRCLGEFRDSPGNWHIESAVAGVCNACHYAERDRTAYGRTRIGF
jgi:hypothetical protein